MFLTNREMAVSVAFNFVMESVTVKLWNIVLRLDETVPTVLFIVTVWLTGPASILHLDTALVTTARLWAMVAIVIFAIDIMGDTVMVCEMPLTLPLFLLVMFVNANDWDVLLGLPRYLPIVLTI